MSGRFNPTDLVKGLSDGLKKRRHKPEDEQADYLSRVILFGLPVLAFGLIVYFRIQFSGADQILAGAALLCGSLMAAFAQIASWRERTLSRNRRVEQIDIRALNEATAHVLVSLMVSVVTVFATFVLSNMSITEDSSTWEVWIVIGMSAISGSTFLYIGLSIIIVANLLWDAYNNQEREQQRENMPEAD